MCDPTVDAASLHDQWFAERTIEQLAIPAFVISKDRRILCWNKACEELTGLPASEIIGRRDYWKAFYDEERPCLCDLVLKQQPQEVPNYYIGRIQTEEKTGAFHVESWCTMPITGKRKFLLIDAGPIRNEDGDIVAVVETFHDETSRKNAETSLSLHASAFENTLEGIVIADPKGIILHANHAFAAMSGYRADEVVGKDTRLLRSGLHDNAFYQRMWESITRTGHWRGEIWNRKKNGDHYPEILTISTVRDDDGEITHFIAMHNDISDLKATQKRLESLVNFDPLTGLPNRVMLAERMHAALEQCRRSNRTVGVCFLDLDGFKPINDRYGHEFGDALLVEVTRRLKQVVRSSDTVARLGGDEFVILLNNISGRDEVEGAMQRILSLLSNVYDIEATSIRISASIGATLYPQDSADPDALLRHADQSMYQAKQLGRNRYVIFDTEMDRMMSTRHQEIERVRQGLAAGEFVLFFQPKVNMRTGSFVGVEALIRWQHPERGLLGPIEFLPLAQKSPLAIEIDRWVINAALTQIEQWAGQGLDIHVSINIAAEHVEDSCFVDTLREALETHPNVSPQSIELEILENSGFVNIDVVRTVLLDCQKLGINFALDDFGTGYSTLTYLRRLPSKLLKIDQSFVRNMLENDEDEAIIRGVVGLAAAFHMNVIAEGVETEAHGRKLLDIGCELAQGYGIARPMPAPNLEEWLSRYTKCPVRHAWIDHSTETC